MTSPGLTTLLGRLLKSPILSALLITAVIAAAVSSPSGEELAADAIVDREAHAYSSAARVLLFRLKGLDTTAWESVCPVESRPPSDLSDEAVAARALAYNDRWSVYGLSANAPLAVSIDSWREDMPRGESTALEVVVLNDTHRSELVDVRLHAVRPDGELIESSRMHRETVPALSQARLSLQLTIPEDPAFLLVAELKARNPVHPTVWQRRKIGFEGPGAATPDPPYRSACCKVG